MKDVIFKDWGWIRVARLIFALYLIYKAYSIGESVYYIIGAVLLYQSIFNIKCITGNCTDDSCGVEQNNNGNK